VYQRLMIRLRIGVLAILSSIVACDDSNGGSIDGPATATTTFMTPPGVPAGTPNYLIDADAGVDGAPSGGYVITTNGIDWIVGFVGDGATHHLTGDFYCPVGCAFEYARFEPANPGDALNTIADNHVGFDAVVEGNASLQIQIAAPDALVTFDLSIDGMPISTTGDGSAVFMSGGQLGRPRVTPFNLVPSNAPAP